RAMVAYLSLLDVESLDEQSASLALTLVESEQAWLSELAVRLTARVAGPTPPPGSASSDPFGPDNIDRGVNLVAATLGMTSGGAQGRVDIARKITESLPKCRLAMAAGFMGYRQAWIVAEAVTAAGLGQVGVAAVDARVASRIKGQSWAAFRRTLRRAVLAADPDLTLAAHTAALKHRWVDKVDLPADLMTYLQFTMSTIDAQTVWLGLDATALQLQAAAEAAGLPDEGIDAYRSDALVAWANHALADPNAPRRRGRRQQVQYLIDLPSLLGLADNPAELVGYGPIPAALVRDRSATADWVRLVVDPVTGYLLDYGTKVYRPPAELADYVMARDRRCRFPGCNARATVCDIDHNIPAPRGDTSAKNCCCLCRHHHRLKTFGGWTVQLKPDGSCLWTSPCGRQFVSDPPPQLD
ncbi:MAG TPA: DUF222 domain-containing protein, partial [Acidothermaceae bacterium]|nr:DUF222 domain-containing protein [Acidothermaceae bacterium]